MPMRRRIQTCSGLLKAAVLTLVGSITCCRKRADDNHGLGIVTKMDLVTVPTASWAEARIYPPTAYPELVQGLMKYHEAIETDNKASLVWHGTSQAILLVFFYCAPVEKPAAFQSFYDIPFVMSFVPPGTRSIYELVQAVASVITSETLQ